MMRRLLTPIAIAALLSVGAAPVSHGMLKSIVAAPIKYALDGLPTPTRAYAFRRLLTSYTTNRLVNIVRASDSATSDIGFTGTGAFNTAAATTFCNATACKIVTIYDQSGNGGDLTQATDANRPALVFSCLGALPCMQATATNQQLAGANITPATGVVSFGAVTSRPSGTSACGIIQENGANNRIQHRAAVAGQLFLVGGSSGNLASSTIAEAWVASASVINGASSTMLSNSLTNAGTVTGNTTAGAPTMAVGITGTTCNHLEAVIWDNVALSTPARQILVGNQRAWYGF